ncbi:hypothetical protein BN129_4426 [Cronobacter sakazakii 701]|nr:hypothetical protein BN129_4426 [Cronobacter sakazakii 701]
MTAFARVRVQTTDQHVRVRDTKFALQVVVQRREDMAQEIRRLGGLLAAGVS